MPRKAKIKPAEIFDRLRNINKIYSPVEVREYCNIIGELPVIHNNKKEAYYNAACAFDIETSSFFDETGEKRACMYEWTLNIMGLTMIGRTWQDFLKVYRYISEYYNTFETCMIWYCHNLSFEFQWIRKFFQWQSVFSLDVREPVKALTADGIQFRCSYQLSGYSLEKVGEHLQRYTVNKKVGDLNYKLIRHTYTPLSDTEIGYCKADGDVVVSYIMEEIERNRGQITFIPLTKTSYVRRYCRKACLKAGDHTKQGNKQFNRYRGLMKALTITPEEYKQLKRAFQGGFTHASADWSGEIVNNVTSFDFTSSYPTVMIAEQLPMSKATYIKNISKREFENSINLYCCIFDCEITNIRAINNYEHILSSSKCFGMSKCQTDNGRVVRADKVYTTLTDVDYKLLKMYYTWDHFNVGDFRRYRRDYLPTSFIESVIKLYEDKTKLKGVAGQEAEYLSSKEMLNSCYGMTVTDPCKPELKYDKKYEWIPAGMTINEKTGEMQEKTEAEKEAEIIELIDKYNNGKGRFLFYLWGVFITAYARRNLIEYGIYPCGNDYIYSDTDSIKIINADKHMDVIDRYNRLITWKLQRACEYHGISFDRLTPKTIKGEVKQIGLWDNDGTYTRFKTLGAKRYLTEYADGHLSLTVSGVNKKKAVPYLLKKYKTNTAVFKHFDHELYIPAEYSGKNVHTYIDDETSGLVTDYTGRAAEYHELSAVHLSESEYSLKLSALYKEYLQELKTIES